MNIGEADGRAYRSVRNRRLTTSGCEARLFMAQCGCGVEGHAREIDVSGSRKR